MPSPVSPQTLSALVPPRNGSFCGRFIPGIINWMQERANFYRWMYKDNGDLTVSFITDLCIAVNGAVVPDPSTCPSIALSAKVLTRHEMLKLTFTGVGMTAGYAWNLYRATAIDGPWGAAITSGTTTGTTISYDDSGLTNDTTYYYKLTVQKTGCPLVSFQTSGTPKLCMTFSFTLNATSTEAGVVTIQAANVDPDYPMDETFTYEVFVNGTSFGTGTLGDSPCTLNGSPGLCLSLSGVPAAAGTLILLNITEKVGCAAVQQFQTIETIGLKPGTPSVSISQGAVIVQYGGGAIIPVAYRIRYRAIGLCNTEPGGFYHEIGPVAPNSGANYYLPVNKTQFPCTENVTPPIPLGGSPGFCKSKYEVWAIAISSSNGVSDPSNVAVMDFPFVPLWPGQCK